MEVGDDGARSELDAIFAKDLGAFFFREFVNFWDERWEEEERTLRGKSGLSEHGCKSYSQRVLVLFELWESRYLQWKILINGGQDEGIGRLT